MPRQNRVTPFGEIVATPERGPSWATGACLLALARPSARPSRRSGSGTFPRSMPPQKKGDEGFGLPGTRPTEVAQSRVLPALGRRISAPAPETPASISEAGLLSHEAASCQE
jgi:hypothetical protein